MNSSLEAQDTRPSKRVFAIMPAGRERVFALDEKSRGLIARDLRIEFLAKLYFFLSIGSSRGK